MATILKSPGLRRCPTAASGPAGSHRISPFGPTAHMPTAAFERAFRDRLAELAAGESHDDAPRRTEITAVCTALRSAVDADGVLRIARGLTAGRLWHAYCHVEELRAGAHAALDAFLADPTPARLARDGQTISKLVPGPTGELEAIAASDPDRLPVAASELADQIRRLDRSVDEIEARLDAFGSHTLAASLDDGWQTGLFHTSAFRPSRVGALMPSRLAELLGEARHEEER